MKQGFCVSLKELDILMTYLRNSEEKLLDFVDLSGMEICRLSLQEIRALAKELERFQMPCWGIHAAFPAEIKLIGKEKNPAVLEDYTKKLVERCDILGHL